MDYKISVIVPVYNVEKYLRQCLESILNQTLRDIEVVIVNDGSEDGSLLIIEEYVNNYNNIVLINKENAGLSSARNEGIRIARGQYISFVDSDDFISSEMLEKMYTKAINTQSEIIIGGYLYCDEEGKFIHGGKNFNCNCFLNKEQIIEGILTNNISSVVCDKIYSKKLFLENYIEFPVGKYFEDTETVFKLILCSENISFIQEKLYYYRLRKGSITNIKNLKMINDYIDGMTSIYNELKKRKIYEKYKIEYQCFCIIKIFQSAIFLYEYIIKNKRNINIFKVLKIYYRQIPRISILDSIINKYLVPKDRLKFILFKLKLLYLLVYIQLKLEYVKE